MKAAIYTNYGPADVMKISNIVIPKPKDSELRIKTYASTVTSGEARIRGMNVPKGFGLMTRLIFGLTKPKKQILGGEFAGVVDSIGKNVKNFKVGDEVFGFTGISYGANAEYFCISENGCLTYKPKNLSFEESAAIPFGGNASLSFLKLAKLKQGEKIMINGASGNLGTMAIQIAKHMGAEVTAVCSNSNVELVKSLGADKVIDYTKTDIFASKEKYDVVYDTVGKISFSDCKDYLNKYGRFIQAVADLPFFIYMALQNSISLLTRRKKKIIAGVASDTTQSLEYLKKLVEDGKLKIVIDKIYSLDEIVEAHKRVDSGHKRGSVVLKIYPTILD